jgi:NAD(P)-dependent dehydrogenase (short-subunit alcohol dehydrogenase family)
MSVIVVTGAASGMGRAAVDRLRNRADHLLAVDLRQPEIEGTVGVASDVSDPASVAALADRVRELGDFRGLVHAAGISPTMAGARKVIEVDLVGTQLILDAFEPLVGPGSAAVCFSSSAAYQISLAPPDPEFDKLLADPLADGFLDAAVAKVGDDSGLGYGWAKRGVVLIAAKAAVRWGARGGRVVSLAPGLIDTSMGRQEMAQQEFMKTILANTPLQRQGSAEEVAALVAFLISDEASFISGIDVLIDGGAFAGLRTSFGLL